MSLTDRLLGPRDDSPGGTEVVRSEERLDVGMETVESGRIRVRKSVEERPYEQLVPRGIEHADVERIPPLPGDTGEVETLPDGSVSIPVFEERIVVEKRLVVRERIVVRKRTVHEEHVVRGDVRREHVDVDTDGVADRVTLPAPAEGDDTQLYDPVQQR